MSTNQLLEEAVIEDFNNSLGRIQEILRDHRGFAPTEIDAILALTSVTTLQQAEAIHDARDYVQDTDLVIVNGFIADETYLNENYEPAGEWEDDFHERGPAINKDNIKYVSKKKDGLYEVVVRPDGNGKLEVVTDDLNRGTANYGSSFSDHVELDVNPWILFGTGSEDTTCLQRELGVLQFYSILGINGTGIAESGTELLGTMADIAKRNLIEGFDAAKDFVVGAKEGLADGTLKTITDILEKFREATTTRSPLIVDLDGDGVETIARSEGVFFDHDGDGFAESTGWVGFDDGLLVVDLNGNGEIDTGAELFGNQTEISADETFENGFLALAAYDTDGNGVVNSADTEFAQLRIWRDLNQTGEVEVGELVTLADAGVATLTLAYADSTFVDANNNAHLQVGSYTTTNGATRVMSDVWFDVEAAVTLEKDAPEVSAEIAAMPNILGFGGVASLHTVMALDTSGALKSALDRFASATSTTDRDTLLNEIMYRWAGVFDIAPDAREATQIYGNAIGDARKLAVLEKFLGYDYIGVWCWGELDPNPHGPASEILLDAYSVFKEMVEGQILAQTEASDWVNLVTLQWSSDTGRVTKNIDALVDTIEAEAEADLPATHEALARFELAVLALGDWGLDLAERIRDTATTAALQTSFDAFGLTDTRGTDAADVIRGDASNDVIVGFAGNDVLQGNDGDDTINGGTGDDRLSGGDGADRYIYNTGDGADTINNFDRDGSVDVLEFGAGITTADVTISRTYYDLLLTLPAAGDSIRVSTFLDEGGTTPHAIDIFRFADGTEWTAADVMDVLNRPTTGDDFIQGSNGIDVVAALAGNDDVSGFGGNDRLSGGTGNDRLSGGDDNDTLAGDDGRDVLQGGAGNDALTGGSGDDRLEGGDGSDSYYFSSGFGRDTIYNYASADTAKWDRIVFDASIEVEDLQLTRSNTALTIKVIGTTDSIYIPSQFSAGTNGIQQIVFADGTKWTSFAIAAETRKGTAQADTLVGSTGADVMTGLGGNDRLYGDDGDDRLEGGDGADQIEGDAGNDRLIGGTGNDRLTGGTGNDTYHFDTGFGRDSISNYEYLPYNAENGYDQISFGDGIRATDVTVSRSYNSVTFTHAGADSVTVSNHFQSSRYAIDRVVFADGTIWYPWKIEQLAQQGTANRDDLRGTAANDIMDGLAGNDTLRGDAGDDILRGGADRDTLQGEDGDDSLDGGIDNDSLTGGLGSDSYLFSRGDGVDTIYNAEYSYQGVNGYDQIVFDNTISAADLSVSRSGDNLVIENAAAGDQITVRSHFSSASSQIDRILFADGTIWYPWKMAQLTRQGTAEADTLIGTDGNDVLNGFAGRDTISGGLGDDTLNGGEDADRINGNDGDDTLIGDAGADTLTGNAGNDRMTGGTGNDYLTGGTGNDSYVFNAAGFGDDRINNYDYAGYNQPNGFDQIIFGDGISDGDVRVQRSGNSLILNLDDSGDSITINNHFSSQTYRIDRISFADGTIWYPWKIEQLSQQGTEGPDDLRGTAANDLLNGFGGRDTIYGEAGNDTLNGGADVDTVYGGDGNDTMSGGAGNDRLYGGNDTDILIGGTGDDRLQGDAGNDTYLFATTGFGSDTINNYDYAGFNQPTGFDQISFGDGIDVSDVRVQRSFNSLILTLDDTGDQITVSSHFNSDRYAMDRVVFADGTIWYPWKLAQLTRQGSAFDDTLYGTEAADQLSGLAGNDILDGEAGDDLLNGGTGNDTLTGDKGNDVYVFDAGFGADRVTNYSFDGAIETDVIRFGVGISADDIAVVRNGSELQLVHVNLTDSIRISSHFSGDRYAIDQVQFSDNTVWTAADIQALSEQGTPISDRLYGTNDSNSIQGFGGNDYIYGYGGDDWLTPGAGRDYVDGGTGSDMVSYSDAVGAVSIDLSRDQATVGADTDTIRNIENATGSVFSDYIIGDANENRIRALGGYDWLIATDGADSFDGGTGRDTVSYQIASSGVTASLSSNRGTAGLAEGHRFTSIENLTGSNHNDVLTGDDDRNVLRGQYGEDLLFGGGGVDRLTGGKSDDTLDGGAGWDYALFSGNMQDYTISTVNAVTTVAFNGSGGDGTDTLTNIEALSFADGFVFL